MLIDGKPSGELLVFPAESGADFRVQGPALLELIKALINDVQINRLSSLIEPFGNSRVLTRQSIASVGILADFDTARLELNLKIPANLRRTNVVYLSGRGLPPERADALSPDPLSGYINVRAGQDFNFPASTVTGSSRRPLNSAFESAVNFRDWIIESNATFISQQPHGLARGDVRMVRDDPNHMLRYSAGDLSYPVSNYQSFRPMAGATVASNFSLQPYRVTVPMGGHEIFLKSPSRVVIYVNGYQAQLLHLPAGRHDLRSLSLGNGINFVRLEITDEVGRTETLEFPWISEADLLAPGLHQFAYSAGFAANQVDNRREYDTKLGTVSIFHRYGVSENLTIGANYQQDRRQLIGGVETLVSTRLGAFSLEPELAQIKNIDPQLGGRLRYLYTDYAGMHGTQRNLTLGVEYKARKFAMLGELTPNVVTSYDLTASYAQVILGSLAARTGFTYDFNRADAQPGIVNGYIATLSLVKGWTTGLQTSLTLSHRYTQLAQRENEALFLFSWMIPETNHFVNFTEDTLRESSRAEWRYNSPQLVGGINTGAAFERSPDANRADLSLDYTGNRGTIGAAHNVTTNWSGVRAQTTNLRGNAALVFSGGKFGVGRPVTDSFALVASSGRLGDQTIEVNPNANEYYEARSDWLGPAVLPNIRSYQYYRFALDPSGLEPGFELGQENYTFLPRYRSGVVVRAGTDATTMLSGALTNQLGKPLSLVSGEARVIGQQTPGIFVFTNRKGKFRVEGFKPGEYELVLYDEELAPIRFTIPENASGIYDIGVIRVRPVK